MTPASVSPSSPHDRGMDRCEKLLISAPGQSQIADIGRPYVGERATLARLGRQGAERGLEGQSFDGVSSIRSEQGVFLIFSDGWIWARGALPNGLLRFGRAGSGPLGMLASGTEGGDGCGWWQPPGADWQRGIFLGAFVASALSSQRSLGAAVAAHDRVHYRMSPCRAL